MSLKTVGYVENNADAYQMLLSVESDLSLHCLIRPMSLNT